MISHTFALQIQSLSKHFGNLKAVDNISLGIHKNEIFGLLGPNGAGKTTTISMICGLIPPTHGSVTFCNGSDYKSLIGYCPQENIFYPKLTCIEQLMFIGQMYGLKNKIIRNRALQLLNMLGLENKTYSIAGKLSGGMKRRLNICLALIHDPEILILDEPEAGLDPQSRILVRDFIKMYGREKTIILTTHNMDEADRIADRIAIMDYGKLLLLDTPQNLKKTVGEGDILELVVKNASELSLAALNNDINKMSLETQISSDFVLIRHPNIIEYLPVIKNQAEAYGITITEIKLRENTLEDVFIHLTGRKLRQ